MKRNGHVTAFYVETLVMIAVLMGILLILASVFGLSRRESVHARRLTEAVTAAQNVAETLSVSRDFGSCCQKLGLEDISLDSGEEGQEECSGSLKDASCFVRVLRKWKSGTMAEHEIRIYDASGQELIYELDTSCYLPEKEGL